MTPPKPREWIGCVVGVRDASGVDGYATIRRTWRRRRDGALVRVVLASGPARFESHHRIVGVERDSLGLRVPVLGAALPAVE